MHPYHPPPPFRPIAHPLHPQSADTRAVCVWGGGGGGIEVRSPLEDPLKVLFDSGGRRL